MIPFPIASRCGRGDREAGTSTRSLFSIAGGVMPDRSRAIAFDVDTSSSASLQEALPGWQIDTVYGATVASLPCDWAPGPVDLLVVGVREDVAETWGLCRFLERSTSAVRESEQAAVETTDLPKNLLEIARRTAVPLLLLLHTGQGVLVDAGLKAGAHSCLMLPINAKEVASMFVHAHAGNEPGRHTDNLEGAQTEDRWRDEGGQG
jgi:hypothetical protein